MERKFLKISLLEWLVLLLTLLFCAGTILWYGGTRPEEGVTVSVTETDRVLEISDAPTAPGMLEGEKLNLNTAAPEDLVRLPGIGETRAQAIVHWRQTYGPFQAPEDLLAVEGIGEATLEELLPYVTVTDLAERGGG